MGYHCLMKELQTTLLLVIKDHKILLAEKKRGFGAGKFNGAGGKLEPGETVEQAMVRETQEEIAITPTKYQKCGVVKFDTYKDGVPTMVVTHIYTADAYVGEPQESEEMKPQWFDLDKIPYDQMYATDTLWLPLIIEGKGYFEAEFKYAPDGALLNQKITFKPEK